jgi:hypothetical protein
MQYLRADTSVKVKVGPLVSVADGFTLVTTFTSSEAEHATIFKHDGSSNAGVDVSAGTGGNTWVAVSSSAGGDGYFLLTVSSSDVDTEGQLTLVVEDVSLVLPIRQDYQVVGTNVFDSLYASSGTDTLHTDVIEMVGSSSTAEDLKDFADALTTINADGIPSSAFVTAPIPHRDRPLSDIPFLVVESTDHFTPSSGQTMTGTRSQDGGAFAAVGGSIAEVGGGIYQFDASSSDMDGSMVAFRFTSTGAIDDTYIAIRTST